MDGSARFRLENMEQSANEEISTHLRQNSFFCEFLAALQLLRHNKRKGDYRRSLSTQWTNAKKRL
jgi:hypothetical protein